MLPIYMFTRRTNDSCPRGFAVRQTTLLGYSTISVACLCLAGGFYLLLAGEATLSLTVLDLESGLPISNATVTAGWEMPNPDGIGVAAPSETHKRRQMNLVSAGYLLGQQRDMFRQNIQPSILLVFTTRRILAWATPFWR